MDGREYRRWREFYRRCPFGPARADLQAGRICQELQLARGRRQSDPIGKFVWGHRPDKKAAEPRPAGLTLAQFEEVAMFTGSTVVPLDKGKP